MATNKQLSNPHLMRQKVDKAQRLLLEVFEAVKLREKPHALWQQVISQLEGADVNLKYCIEALEDIRAYNNQREAEKI